MDKLIFAIIPTVILVTLAACQTKDPDELKARAVERATEGLVTISPRPGVECYILRGTSTYNTQAMSCVFIPQ